MILSPVRWAILATALSIVAPTSGSAQCLTLVDVGLPLLDNARAYWGDCDADGDADLLVSAGSTIAPVCRVYRNDGANFTALAGEASGIAAGWVDFDGDVDLDFLVFDIGGPSSTPVPRIFRNDGGTFVDSGVAFDAVSDGAAAFGDLGGDGDLDLAIAGRDDGGAFTLFVYENEGGSFQAYQDPAPGVAFGDLEWVDLDNDGDQDLFVTGLSTTGLTTQLLRNESGTLVAEDPGLPGFAFSACSWADFDLDGDRDLAVTGNSTLGQFTTRIYRNDHGSLVSIDDALPGFNYGDVAWGDADGDGDLDLALSGASQSSVSRVLMNEAGVFADSGEAFALRTKGTVGWADVDGDFDLDLLLCGLGGDLQVLENGCAAPNTVPAPPSGLTVDTVADSIIVTWTRGVDLETPPSGVGSSFYIEDGTGTLRYIATAAANPASGARMLNLPPNAGVAQSFAFDRYAPPMTSIGVQTVDSYGAGSAFAAATLEDWTCFRPDATFGALQSLDEAMPAVADFDADGDDDLAILGTNGLGQPTLDIYENQAGLLVLLESIPVAAGLGTLAWADQDGDGDLDLSLAPKLGPIPVSNEPVHFYRNEITGFELVVPAFAPFFAGELEWADYDGDGRVDIMMTGWMPRILRGTASGYVLVREFASPNRVFGAAWADVDGDFDLDLAVAGKLSDSLGVLLVENDGGQFPVVQSVDAGFDARSVAWGDYDDDGDPDLVALGFRDGDDPVLVLYTNDGGVLSAALSIPMVTGARTRMQWRDIDGNGRRDLVGARRGDDGAGAWILRNLASGFQFDDFHSGVDEGLLAPIDVDDDGVHEFVVCESTTGADTIGIWLDDCATPNTPPQAPAGLEQVRFGAELQLSWDPAVDAETVATGLEYLLRIGTTPGAKDAGEIVLGGSAGRLVWTGELDSLQYYYWSVSARDAAGATSAFASRTGCESHTGWDEGARSRNLVWADYDGDGDWDYVHSIPGAIVFRQNVNGIFDSTTLVGDSIFDEVAGFDWADYDGDGDLDLAADWGQALSVATRGAIFRNDDGTLVRTDEVLPALGHAFPRWGDIDGDGDTDLVVAGTRYPRPGSTWARVSVQYNEGATLGAPQVLFGHRQETWLPVAEFQDVDLVDYDTDGDLDLLLVWSWRVFGSDPFAPFSVLLRNDGGTFTQVDDPLGPGNLLFPTTDWADVDGDGAPEVAVAGIPAAPTDPGRGVFRIVGGAFELVGGPMGNLAATLGDWNSDGYPDLFTNMGFTYAEHVPGANKIFDLQVSGIADLMILPPPFTYYFGSAFLDFDGDGRLDLVVAGNDDKTTEPEPTLLVANLCSPQNSAPIAPSGLQLLRDGDQVTFSWGSGTDAETPAAGLSYALMVGTTAGGMDIMPAHADPTTGRRTLAEPGNVGWRTSWTLTIPAGQQFYWGVQSVDAGFKGSPFAFMTSEGLPTSAPSARTHSGIHRVHPNPFNPSTTVEYAVDQAQHLAIGIFDTRGRLVRSLLDADVPAGLGRVDWDGRDSSGQLVAGGVYYVMLRGEGLRDVRKVALVK